ncbi:unnamed protein product [Toxocara canis]|uniref:SAM-dependent methyltransferase n=1 Tax=Toxocara canis TaxID=6265 RepID=A0A183UUT7_TOXCA|nr:unnamed protein product [Toxocara canis]
MTPQEAKKNDSEHFYNTVRYLNRLMRMAWWPLAAEIGYQRPFRLPSGDGVILYSAQHRIPQQKITDRVL